MKNTKSLIEKSFIDHNQKVFEKIKQKVKPFFDNFEDIKGLYLYVGGSDDGLYVDENLPKNTFIDLMRDISFVFDLGVASVKVTGKSNRYHTTKDTLWDDDKDLIKFDEILQSISFDFSEPIMTFTNPDGHLLYVGRDSSDIKFVKSKESLERFEY